MLTYRRRAKLSDAMPRLDDDIASVAMGLLIYGQVVEPCRTESAPYSGLSIP